MLQDCIAGNKKGGSAAPNVNDLFVCNDRVDRFIDRLNELQVWILNDYILIGQDIAFSLRSPEHF